MTESEDPQTPMSPSFNQMILEHNTAGYVKS